MPLSKYKQVNVPLVLIGDTKEERRDNLRQYFADANIDVDNWPNMVGYTDINEITLLCLVCACGEHHLYRRFTDIPMEDTICSDCKDNWIILGFGSVKKMRQTFGHKTLWDHVLEKA